MVTDTNSCAAEVPLLVLRLPDFERVAWRSGTRAARRLERRTTGAFVAAARGIMRGGDRLVHASGSDVYCIFMSGSIRSAAPPRPADCRAALRRVAASMSAAAQLPVESGWTFAPAGTAGGPEMDAAIAAALERGAREHERYEFFAAVGHELRTPLTSIRGYLDTLLDGGAGDTERQRFLQTAQREALRMGRMLERMVEFSLLDLSPETLERSSCHVGAQAAAACEIVRPLALKRGMKIECVRAPDAVATMHPDACLQLFLNLLENAVKHGHEGGRAIARVVVEGDTVIACVEDDGPGIDTAQREIVFAPRMRAGSAAPGNGLGLAIVRLIAERAGGSAWCQASPLGGAAFYVKLPVRAESSAGVS